MSRYQTFDELAAYCRLSADPVGHLVLYVFDRATPERMRLADRICTGLQLVEHLQDVGEDLARGRVYLPQDDMSRFGCSDADLGRRPRLLRAGPRAGGPSRPRALAGCSGGRAAGAPRCRGRARPRRHGLRLGRPGGAGRHRRRPALDVLGAQIRPRASSAAAAPRRHSDHRGAPREELEWKSWPSHIAHCETRHDRAARGQLLLRDPPAAARQAAGDVRRLRVRARGRRRGGRRPPAEGKLSRAGRDPAAARGASGELRQPMNLVASTTRSPLPACRWTRSTDLIEGVRDGRERAPATSRSTSWSSTAGGWPARSAGSASPSSARPTRARRPSCADDLGVAMQLTNILRDVREDHGTGRVYLPPRISCASAATRLLDGPPAALDGADRVRGDARAGVVRARPRAAAAARPRSRSCVLAMTGIYRRLLARIEFDPARSCRAACPCRRWEKLRVAARSLAGAAHERPRVVVVGGGLAGHLGRASTCADGGVRSRCSRSPAARRGRLLVRARRALVDNGQHVFLRCCTPTGRSSTASAPSRRPVLQERL